MIDHYALVRHLTSEPPPGDRQLNDFAFELGWKPSDRLDLPAAREFTTAHLVVEHGLDYTAVISFLLSPRRFLELTPSQKRCLASASYNNLIDWHINIDFEEVTFLYNRYRPPEFHSVRQALSPINISVLQSSRFQEITAKHPAPDVPPLDRAVVETVSLWKRQLGAEIPGITNTALSALFNAILFVRAAEDHRRGAEPPAPELGLLCRTADNLRRAGGLTVQAAVSAAVQQLAIEHVPPGLIDLASLTAFSGMDASLVVELFEDFYRNRFARYYEYDFSLISKHALSRIYEHYVSILRVPHPDQISFLPSLAEEMVEWKLGTVYTPEFIARFFARYLRMRLPGRAFQRLRAIDPSCGSGIFLRCLLELQNEALFDFRTTESIRGTFQNVIGIDLDPNACHAAQLSLSLLCLVLAGELPEDLKILNEEALRYYLQHPDFRDVVDVVVANPPYIKFEAQPPDIQQRVLAVLGEHGSGRPDMYLAILKVGLEFLKPGGYGLFVLPESFLKSTSAASVRELISQQAWIECVADLTAVRIFENVGVYTILLVFQKRNAFGPAPLAKIVRCQDRVGQALQDVLDERVVTTPFYSIHEATQEAFEGREWSLAPPTIALMLKKYADLAPLGHECDVRQGMNTGADYAFILPRRSVPEDGQDLFAPLLTDREMESYTVPRNVSECVFYPYVGGDLIEESQLRKHSKTWAYLNAYREKLEKRSAVKTGAIPWWRPERPREPRHMFGPKIVTPHLVISPRFGLDARGKFAISRAPVLFSNIKGAAGRDHLTFLLGILNSSACFWHIAQRSHVYDRGYSRLEVATLKGIRTPAFSSVDRGVARKLVRLVENRIEATAAAALELEDSIDDLVADLYGLTSDERRIVGMREPRA